MLYKNSTRNSDILAYLSSPPIRKHEFKSVLGSCILQRFRHTVPAHIVNSDEDVLMAPVRLWVDRSDILHCIHLHRFHCHNGLQRVPGDPRSDEPAGSAVLFDVCGPGWPPVPPNGLGQGDSEHKISMNFIKLV